MRKDFWYCQNITKVFEDFKNWISKITNRQWKYFEVILAPRKGKNMNVAARRRYLKPKLKAVLVEIYEWIVILKFNP